MNDGLNMALDDYIEKEKPGKNADEEKFSPKKKKFFQKKSFGKKNFQNDSFKKV